MIKITQLKLPVSHTQKDLHTKIQKTLKLPAAQDFTFRIVRRSLDARKKPELFYVYTIYVTTAGENRIVKKVHLPSVSLEQDLKYQIPQCRKTFNNRPVIVGAGPAGLFCAYILTKAGIPPIVLERGEPIEKRQKSVEEFWKSGILRPNSNVQFGEGGAGTFSDGKLNSVVKDPSFRNQFVLDTFVRFGAPEQICYDAKPHIGTDILAKVIVAMRKELQQEGCEFHFETEATDFVIQNQQITHVICENQTFETEHIVLALGHSARNTFVTLQKHQLPMEAKNFAVGFRVEHPQNMMDEAMYGRQTVKLPAASYKVTSNFPNGRGVYSFCMCPGGYVVNSSSSAGQTVVNGMSYSGRNGSNANSAIIISVGPQDFGAEDALAGMRYQQQLEKKAYALGNGAIPQQLFSDYVQNCASNGYGDFASCTKGATTFANLRGLLSADMEQSFLLGMEHFEKLICGFARKDAILSGIESRTSSPIRLLRDEQCESAIRGIFPCGEGAGYAGGIMSAAIDGIRVAEQIIKR